MVGWFVSDFPFHILCVFVWIKKKKRHANTSLFPICGVILECIPKWVVTKNGYCVASQILKIQEKSWKILDSQPTLMPFCCVWSVVLLSEPFCSLPKRKVLYMRVNALRASINKQIFGINWGRFRRPFEGKATLMAHTHIIC